MASCRRTCKTSLLAGFVNTARIPQALAVGVCQLFCILSTTAGGETYILFFSPLASLEVFLKKLSIILFTVLFICFSVGASSRVSVGVSCLSIGSQNALAGENEGVKRMSSIAPALVLEGEVIPIEQFSVFMRASCAPFKPTIKASNVPLPFDKNTLDYSTLTALFQVGLGWQLPLSYWTRLDFPLEISVGALGTLGLMSYSSLTPDYNYSATSTSFGAGLFETFSYYFSSFGVSLTATQNFSFSDTTKLSMQYTSQDKHETSVSGGTPVICTWDVSLAFSYRFGR